jgi:hypothetical protein
MINRISIIFTNKVFRYFLFFCIICFLKCASDSPHNVLIGHWKVKSTFARLDNPDSEGGEADVIPADIYFSDNFFWRHEPGRDPFKLNYKVIEEDLKNFSLKICVTNIEGEEIFSTVEFSSDFKEIRIITKKDPLRDFPPEIANEIRGEIDSLILETVCIRVDDRISP